ncbi:hypothetical protein [Streptosporangium sp. NPDC006007]|uniref:hypothetical protein n=1 Tax=Streptosporangium sp. NPDC006007 TaxID=3154575 RepID=UPI0033BCFCCB
MSLLEDRYRYVLRMLPASYRAEREEEMVCAFMEGAGDLDDADNPRPRWSEIASVAALAARVRLGGAGAPPRFVVRSETIRLVAVLGLGFHAAMSCVWLGDLLRLYGLLGSPPAVDQAVLGAAGSAERLWGIVRNLSGLLWVVAFVSLARGRSRTAKTSALLALGLYYGSVLPAGAMIWDESVKAGVVRSLVFVLPVLALLAGFHRDAPRPRRPWWVAALPVGAGVLLHAVLSALFSVMSAPAVDPSAWSWLWPWLGEPGLACLALLTASVACVGTRLRVPATRTPSLPSALAILIVPVVFSIAFDVIGWTFQVDDPITRTMEAVSVVQLVALLLCCPALILLSAKVTPALPGTAPPSAVNPRAER